MELGRRGWEWRREEKRELEEDRKREKENDRKRGRGVAE